MSRFTTNVALNLSVNIRLSESELRGLHAITLYGYEAFLKSFKTHLGNPDELHHNEDGLKSLFDTITREVPSILKRSDAARIAFNVGTNRNALSEAK